MKAILTRYHGPTNFKGSKITATAEGGSKPHRVSVPYPHEARQGADAHAIAAVKLCNKLGWTGELVSGGLPNGDYVFVFASSERYQITSEGKE